MEKENLYFVAIIPPNKICDEITGFKLDFEHRFESKAALKVIPHITLKAPFKLPVSGHLDLMQWFQKIFFESGSFPIELKDFGAFYNKDNPVLYVQPVISRPLVFLQKEIIRSFRISYPALKIMDVELKFKPHITIAYRDLTFDKFLEALEEYKTKEYRAVFDVRSFYLLQYNGKIWNVIDTYYFT